MFVWISAQNEEFTIEKYWFFFIIIIIISQESSLLGYKGPFVPFGVIFWPPKNNFGYSSKKLYLAQFAPFHVQSWVLNIFIMKGPLLGKMCHFGPQNWVNYTYLWIGLLYLFELFFYQRRHWELKYIEKNIFQKSSLLRLKKRLFLASKQYFWTFLRNNPINFFEILDKI